MLHRHRGITFVTDHTSKVGITAWDEATCKCGLEATCYRGFCDNCCWGCSEHVRCMQRRAVHRGVYYGYNDNEAVRAWLLRPLLSWQPVLQAR